MNRKTGVALSYVLMIFEVLSTLLLTPYILRTLGQAEYGVYRLSASIAAYLLLLDLGVGNAIIRYIAKFRANNDKEQSRKFLGIATFYYSAIAIAAIIVGIFFVVVFPQTFSKGLTPDEIQLGQKLLLLTMVNAAVTLGTAAYNNIIIAYEQFAVSKGASIVQIILRMVLTVVTLMCGWGSIGIVTINLIMTVLYRGVLVLYVLLHIKLLPQFHGIEFGFIKEIVTYSSLILLQMIATQLNSTVDQVLIGSLVTCSSAILTVYSVGAQVTQYYQSIGAAFTGVLMPGIVGMIEHGADAKCLADEMIRIGRIILIVVAIVWGGFLVCGQQFIILWAGKENTDAYCLAVILMTAYMFILAESIGTQILWAMNQHKEQTFLKIAIVLINIPLTIVLIQWRPLLGATIGTFISLMLGDVVVMNVIFRKRIKINLWYYYKGLTNGIIPSVLIAMASGFFIRCLWQNGGWVGLFIKVTIICFVYAVCMLLFGMNSYEKSLTASIVRRYI